MKKIIQLLFAGFFFTSVTFAQEFKGQWKGQFTDNSSSFLGWGGERCDYVLELEVNGTEVSGYSYTYFNDGGKRYYTICKLAGKLNKRSKYIEVKETERTKTNVPTHIRNCFQVHKLTYFKQGDEQLLEGSWVPAPKQEGDCGYGTTKLSRRVLKTANPIFDDAITKNTKPPKKNDSKLDSIFKDKNKKTTPPVVNNSNKTFTQPIPVKPKPFIKAEPKITTPPTVIKTQPKIPAPPAVKAKPDVKAEPKIPTTPPVAKTNPVIKPKQDMNFEKRNNNLIKTIEIENETFKVDLYDNGDIDGDTISLFFNGRLLLSNKRLSDKPLSLTLNAESNNDVNELVMYAENLGSIPPNTALMIVTDGSSRYEVRLTSDLEKSGAIRFVHKPKGAQ